MQNKVEKYKGKIFQIVQTEQPDGRIFEKAIRSPGVRIIIDDKANRKILLTRERRSELDSEVLDYRIPGGKVFDSLDEFIQFEGDLEARAMSAGLNESEQETGIKPNKLEFVYKIAEGATIDWDLYYFSCSDFKITEQRLELGEEIRVDWVSYDKAMEIAKASSPILMNEGRSAITLVRYLETLRG